jgi:hypothetical protein
MRRLFAALGTCGLVIGVAAAADPPAPAPSVSELISRLGSGDFREREAATAALHKAGPGAIPALREAARSDDPEVRGRAAGVLFRLQRTAESEALLAPKKLKLEYRNAPLGVAVNDLAARTGLNLTLDPSRIADPLRTVTCATGALPVWEAVERFCAAAGLEELHRPELEVPKQPLARRGYPVLPQPPAPDAVPVTLVDGTARLPGARGSAVRVVALPKSYPGHRVALGTGETTFCLDVTPAPGLNWQDVIAVRVTKLIDDAGRPGGAGSVRPDPVPVPGDVVVAWGGAVPPGGWGGRGFAFQMGRFDPQTGMPLPPDGFPNPRIVPVPLKLATPDAKSIRRLEGHVLGEIQVPNQTLVTIDNPSKRVGEAVSGAGQTRLTVTGVSDVKGGGTQLQVAVQCPSPWAASARRGLNPGGVWPEAPRAGQMPVVKVFDAAGKELPAAMTHVFSDSADNGHALVQHANLVLHPGAGTVAKVVLVGPRPVAVEVPFVLENVPLP